MNYNENFILNLQHFRSRTYQFEEFLVSWAGRLKDKGVETNSITVRLLQDVDKYHVCIMVELSIYTGWVELVSLCNLHINIAIEEYHLS